MFIELRDKALICKECGFAIVIKPPCPSCGRGIQVCLSEKEVKDLREAVLAGEVIRIFVLENGVVALKSDFTRESKLPARVIPPTKEDLQPVQQLEPSFKEEREQPKMILNDVVSPLPPNIHKPKRVKIKGAEAGTGVSDDEIKKILVTLEK